LILFSFTTAGVPRFLTEAQREWASDPLRARREIGRLTRETMGSPYPARAANSEPDRVAAFGVGTAPPEAEEALHRASTSLLGVAGMLSMIPGGYAPAAEQIEVPVLIALGDHDLHDENGLAAMLPKSPRVETFVLEDCWHCHFVANTREALWQRVASWIEEQVPHP
jgi:pimeloyl-ACP methyl ester carboxylesterase